jgi:hypothetical protein
MLLSVLASLWDYQRPGRGPAALLHPVSIHIRNRTDIEELLEYTPSVTDQMIAYWLQDEHTQNKRKVRSHILTVFKKRDLI